MFRHSFQRTNPDVHKVTAILDGVPIGWLTWGAEDHEIRWVSVVTGHRHHGVATGMFYWAQEIDPLIHHSPWRTPDGDGWKENLDGRSN